MKVPSLLLLTFLPGCVAAIGNTGYRTTTPAEALPLLQQRVDTAQRIVDLRQRSVDELLALQQAGQVTPRDLNLAQIALEESRLVLLQCKAELVANQRHEAARH
ncbi:MAG: hypothetical protein IT455_11035 [Planctomycetes bacterium]|nr:hypothetical protein [Planctomycetota bacterium]